MIKYFLQLYRTHTLMRFLLVGGLNTLFGYFVFSICIFLNAHYSAAALISLLTGILFNFLTYGNWVFYNNTPSLILKFALAYALIYGVNVLALHFLLAQHMNTYLAQALLIIPLAVFAYKLNKDFVFCSTKRAHQ